MKKSTPVRYLITILLFAIIFTSVPFIYAEPVDAADYSNAVVNAYTEDNIKIPKINLKGDVFDDINDEIWDRYYTNGLMKHRMIIDYQWYVKGDVLSLTISSLSGNEMGFGDYPVTDVYNILLPSGEYASTSYVLGQAGMSEAQFYKKVKEAMGSEYADIRRKNLRLYDKSSVDSYNRRLGEVIADSKVKSAIPFFDRKGELWATAKITQNLAYDSMSYGYITNLSNYALVKDYDKKLEVQAYPVNLTWEQAAKKVIQKLGLSATKKSDNTYYDSKYDYEVIYKGIARGKDTSLRGSSNYYYYRSEERYYIFRLDRHIRDYHITIDRFASVDTRTGEISIYNVLSYPSVYDAVVEPVNEIKNSNTALSGISNKTYTGSAITQDSLTVKYNGRTLRRGTDYSVAYKNNKNVGTATVEVTGMGNYGGKVSKTFKITAKLPSNATRVFGSSRYATATKIADTIKSLNGNKKFEAVIVATGSNYPDALGGAYLAKSKNAPIVITSSAEETNTVKYISNNVAKSGTVYILGGTGAVSSAFEQKVRSGGRRVVRLGGKTRYETNIKILKEAGSLGSELIVVTGKNFPDALSASAAGKPILLVGDTLTNDQGKFVKNNNFSKITIIGGKGVVSENIKVSLSKYGIVARVYGANRYETSSKVAKKYFGTSKNMVMAIGNNYPDALTGGPLAMKLKAPLILTSSNSRDYAYAKSYRKTAGVKKGYILGGPSLIDNQAATSIMK